MELKKIIYYEYAQNLYVLSFYLHVTLILVGVAAVGLVVVLVVEIVDTVVVGSLTDTHPRFALRNTEFGGQEIFLHLQRFLGFRFLLHSHCR